MDGSVTLRMIAYAACLVSLTPILSLNSEILKSPVPTVNQVHFCLTDEKAWSHKGPIYENIEYVAFYEFLVDFLEDCNTEQELTRSSELLDWYNR